MEQVPSVAAAADSRQPYKRNNAEWWYLNEANPAYTWDESKDVFRLYTIAVPMTQDGHPVSMTLAVTVYGFSGETPTTDRLRFEVTGTYVDDYHLNDSPYTWDPISGMSFQLRKFDGSGRDADPSCSSTRTLFRNDWPDYIQGHNLYQGTSTSGNHAIMSWVAGLALITDPALAALYSTADMLLSVQGFYNYQDSLTHSDFGTCSDASFTWFPTSGTNLEAEAFHEVGFDVLKTRAPAEVEVDISAFMTWYNGYPLTQPITTPLGPIKLLLRKDFGAPGTVTVSGVSGSDIRSTSVTVRWARYNGLDAAYYDHCVVWHRVYGTATWSGSWWIYGINTVSFTVSGLAPSTRYEFSVQVTDVFTRIGPASNIVAATTTA
jgi:hypothetical protein